jgi:hypothetical protein
VLHTTVSGLAGAATLRRGGRSHDQGSQTLETYRGQTWRGPHELVPRERRLVSRLDQQLVRLAIGIPVRFLHPLAEKELFL